ncbi:hypothetical protein GH714_014483 [Hevea brasiliensis]|uniref:Cytochrome P450 n=1 Tax=Hevea brasiliensis TaxID=3981 RepID=A0A6A6NH45_HEVBR|nr:hypothetical protein GH714_014483 [Hevea brasiliensis]
MVTRTQADESFRHGKEKKEDFMDELLSIMDNAKEFSSQDVDTIIKFTCLALILAASDSTAVTLTWTLSLLLNNRHVLKKAQQELDIIVEFIPERFLTTHKDVDVKGQNFELIPFSSGRRMCPGVSFAVQVLNLTLATLLHSFEIETPSGQPVDMTEGAGQINIKVTPIDALLEPRLPPHFYCY